MTLAATLQPVLDKRLPAALVAGVLLIGASNAFAQTNLEPDTSAFASEPGAYVSISVMPRLLLLKDAYTPDVRLRVVVMPEIYPTYAMGIRQRKTSDAVFVLKLSLEAPRNTDVTRCEAPISVSDTSRLIEIWKQMLLRTSYRQGATRKYVMLDGADYHFSLPSYPQSVGPLAAPVPGASKAMQGQIFNPDPDTQPGLMVGIVEKLDAYCWSKDARSLAQANDIAGNLLYRLNAGNPP
jgi:hypothetical protein